MEIKKMIKNILPYGYVNKTVQGHYNAAFAQADRLYPEVCNGMGGKMSIYYLQDTSCLYHPYSLVRGRFPEKILWDRFNKALPVHFYSNEEMNRASGGVKKYGILLESELVAHKAYHWALKEAGPVREFKKIFTHSARLLDKYENAVFAPANGVWYGTIINGGHMNEDQDKRKSKNVSMVSSDKMSTPMHRRRMAIAKHCMSNHSADVYGKASGNFIEHKADALESYRYSIAVENDRTPYYFTEKILDCFASMTVPIYMGASEIDKFFNADGIIQIQNGNEDEIDGILKRCNELDYSDRLGAIKDNYNRVKEFLSIEDYITSHYKI